MPCSGCGRIRKHYHGDSNSLRGLFCKKCRKEGYCQPRYCRFCGSLGCTEHGDRLLIQALEERHENEQYEQYEEDDIEECYDEGDFDDDYETSGNEVDDDRRLVSYGEGSARSRSHASSRHVPSNSDQSESRSRVSSRNTRHKCDRCRQWFEFKDELEFHEEENDSGCTKCSMCFPKADAYEHARNNRHDRCFVDGCNDKYARLGSWTDREIEEHVWESHCSRSRARQGRQVPERGRQESVGTGRVRNVTVDERGY